MRRRRSRLLRSAGFVSVAGLLALNGWLMLLNLDKHGRVPPEARNLPGVDEMLSAGGRSAPDGEGADGRGAVAVLGAEPTSLADEGADPIGASGTGRGEGGGGWPGGPAKRPDGPPEPREVLLTADGDLRVIGSAPSWSLVRELAGVLGRRSGLGAVGVTIAGVTWHPDASDEIDDAVVRLEEPLLYDSGEIGVPDGAVEALVSAIALLEAQPALRLVVVAHVDDLGDSAANGAVASARAAAVADELIARGVEPARVATAVADRDPEAPAGDDEEIRRHNRRVEVRIENLLAPTPAVDLPASAG